MLAGGKAPRTPGPGGERGWGLLETSTPLLEKNQQLQLAAGISIEDQKVCIKYTVCKYWCFSNQILLYVSSTPFASISNRI